ncbi:MAG: hypothetical protein J0M11_23045 [Anaerolineae bacterium]|nr:hypothetical protein [Anaerolineae bacterium]
MPTFNRGIYKGRFEYDAKPLGRWRTISRKFRWYRPYAPGERVDFLLSVRTIDNSHEHIIMVKYEDGKNEQIKEIHCTPIWATHSISGMAVSGQGAVDYRFGRSTEDDSVLVASVVATHNDAWTMLVSGGIITLACTIFGVAITWLLSFINIIPRWNMWMPDFIVEFLRKMIE